MNTSAADEKDRILLRRAVETTIRIGLIAILAIYCYQIVRPFLIPIVWGVIIAVAIYPSYSRLQEMLGGRPALAAVLITILALFILIIPTVMLSDTLVSGGTELAKAMDSGTLSIPPAPDGVSNWPVIGEPMARFWNLASVNLGAALGQVEPQLKVIGQWLLGAIGGAGLGILQFILAIIIAGIFLRYGESGSRMAQILAARLADERGEALLNLSRATIRSVARGILGVALIQTILAGLGFLAVGVPGAGLWAALCLLLAVIQVGIFPIIIPVLIYVFSTADTMTAVIFLVWSIFVGTLDNILKPILLGRGVNVPMAVIFIGAIGGFLTSGIIGLFIGAVILVLGYEVLLEWLRIESKQGSEDGAGKIPG